MDIPQAGAVGRLMRFEHRRHRAHPVHRRAADAEAAVGIQVDGTGGGGLVYAWGGQVELGPTTSSYIATTTAAATRAADRQFLSGQAIDAAAGLAVIAEFAGQVGGQTMVPVCFTPASGSFTDS